MSFTDKSKGYALLLPFRLSVFPNPEKVIEREFARALPNHFACNARSPLIPLLGIALFGVATKFASRSTSSEQELHCRTKKAGPNPPKLSSITVDKERSPLTKSIRIDEQVND
jgi:hypothetical protein